MRYVFTVWLTEPTLPPDDIDYQWPACFLIDAQSETSAKEWGDHLSLQYAMKRGGTVIRSDIEALETSTLPGLDHLPVITEGQDATDEEIGW